MSSQKLDRDFCCHDSTMHLKFIELELEPVPMLRISTIDDCIPASRIGSDTSVPIVKTVTDNEKSSFFENLLFDIISKRVLERNKRLFEELSKY